MQRVQRLLDGRIIREITPIFDTRALGYSSMLVAAKVDPEHPHRAAKFINTHPGVTHNYLRNHDFNLWFTLATEPGSPLGLDGTLDVIAAKTGAESIRQLPTLKLFKIRMDLEMEKGTDALAAAGEAVEPRELDPIELSDEDVATIRATQGPMPVIEEPYAPAAERLGVDPGRGAAPARVAARAQRAAPRRRDPLPPPRRASRPTAWACGRCRRTTILDTGRQMAAFRGISHCYQRPTYAGLALLRLHDGPRPLEGGVRRGPRRGRRARPASPSARRSTRAPSSRRSGCSTSPARSATGSGRTPEPPCRLADRYAVGGALPPRRPRAPGRRQLARARDALDRARPGLRRARRGRRAHRRRRQHLRRLRLLLGPADPRPRLRAGARRGAGGGRARHDVRRADRRRGRAGRAGRPAHAVGRDAADDLVGHRGVDERDPARARRHRPREGRQVRRRLPRPRRRPARRGRLRPRHAGHPRLARACPRPPPRRP